MIKSFADADAEMLWDTGKSRRIPAQIRAVALKKIAQLDSAEKLDDLSRPPGNRLEMLQGDRAGQYSIRINDQFRLCFVWDGDDSHHVEVVDYH